MGNSPKATQEMKDTTTPFNCRVSCPSWAFSQSQFSRTTHLLTTPPAVEMPHGPENSTYWWLSTSGPSHGHHPGSTAPTELGEAEDQGHEEGYQRGARWGHKQEGPAHLYPFKRGQRQRDLTLGPAAQEPLSTEGKIPLQKSIAGS